MTINIPLPFWAIMLIAWVIVSVFIIRGSRATSWDEYITPVFGLFSEIIWTLVSLCIYLLFR